MTHQTPTPPLGEASPTATTIPQHSSNTPRKKRPYLLWGSVTAALIVVLAVGGTVYASKAAEQQQAEELEEFRANQFSNVAKSCIANTDAFDIMDDGDSIEFPRATKLGQATSTEVFCFLKRIGAPASLETKIGQTRALDGTRTDEWAEFEASWTYHPDSGLNLLVERTGEPVPPED